MFKRLSWTNNEFPDVDQKNIATVENNGLNAQSEIESIAPYLRLYKLDR